MRTAHRNLLLNTINGNYSLKGDKLILNFPTNDGIIAVDLTYGNNKAVYDKGLHLREKFNSEIDEACEELNI